MTGTETCNGVACFVSVYYTIGNTVNTQVDRGCYFNQQIIIHRCSNTIQETDGTLGQSVCCNESDFCNENTTLNFSYVTTSASAPPTSALSISCRKNATHETLEYSPVLIERQHQRTDTYTATHSWVYMNLLNQYLEDRRYNCSRLQTLGVQCLPIISPTRTEFRVFSVGSMSRVKRW